MTGHTAGAVPRWRSLTGVPLHATASQMFRSGTRLWALVKAVSTLRPALTGSWFEDRVSEQETCQESCYNRAVCRCESHVGPPPAHILGLTESLSGAGQR